MSATPTDNGAEVPVNGGTSSDAGAKPVLTAREQEVLIAGWLSIKGAEPQIDYERLAKILGLKNSKSANAVFGVVKKKVKIFNSQAAGSGGSGEPLSSPIAKTTPRKRVAGDPATPKTGRGKKAKSETPTPKTPQTPLGVGHEHDGEV